ncbi:hypothetical protein Tco_0139674 [Tanacetum coccineum]
MMHSISPCRIFITAMCAYSFTMHHRYGYIEKNLRDPIDIRVDIIHPEPVAAVAFPAAAIMRDTSPTRGGYTRGLQENLLARIKTTEAIEKITRNRERQARVKIEQQLAAVQESQRQDREDFRKLKELVTSQLGRHS